MSSRVAGPAGVPRGAGRAGPARPERGVRRRRVLPGERGDGEGVPLGNHRDAASPAVTLVEATLAAIRVPRNGPGRPRQRPERPIGDKAYDGDPLRERLKGRGVELIAPHRGDRVAPPTQDGRKLRRYRRRWVVGRTIAWLGNFRRLVVRWERYPRMFGAFVHAALMFVTLRILARVVGS